MMVITRTLDRIAAIPAVPMAGIVMGAAVLLPFIVHLVPTVNGTPIGSWLLPIFYAPLLAVILRRPAVAVFVAFVAPVANYLVIGTPTLPITAILTVELVTFCATLALVTQRWRGFWGTVLIAYLFAKVASLILLIIYPIIPADPVAYTLSSMATGLPGVVIMLILTMAVSRYVSENSFQPD